MDLAGGFWCRWDWHRRCWSSLRKGVVTMRALVVLLGLLLATSPAANGHEQLNLQVSPQQSFAPSTIVIRIRITRSHENRALIIAADSGEYYRSSVVPLEGADAPAIVTPAYRDLPGGDYRVHCTLVDGAGRERAAAQTDLSVISPAS